MRVRVLGPLELEIDGRVRALAGSRRRRLLVALLVDAGAVVPIDALVDAVWGDGPPTDPRNALQTAASRLRDQLGPGLPLVTEAVGYRLDVGADVLDALAFEDRLASGLRTADPVVRRDHLTEALALWRGPAYHGEDDRVAGHEATRLEERRRVAVDELAAARLRLGDERDLAALEGELAAALRADPLRERTVRLRMATLARLGRTGDALEVARSHRTTLVEATGLEPAARFADLERRILRGELDAPGPGTAAGPARADVATTAPARSAPPPDPGGELIGRDRDLGEVQRSLRVHPVVTLVGPGGVGKTRLAAEVARRPAAGAAPDVTWVELAPLDDAAALEHVLAAALDVDTAGADQLRPRLLTAVRSRHGLLVLDNAEHLIDAVADLVADLRAAAPSLRVLVTSRERLAIGEERVHAVAPLSVEVDARPGAPAASRSDRATHDDDTDGLPPAVALFVTRARAAGVEPPVDAALVEICRELGGLPLAIELAAARVRAVPPPALLTALRADDAGALGSRRAGPARHRDLDAVVAWSEGLLTDDERRTFRRLAVFADRFDASLAHEVTAADGESPATTHGRLAALVERSLVEPTDAGSFRLLRPIRACARRQLVRADELHPAADRHLDVLTRRVERAAAAPLTTDDLTWLVDHLDEARAAWRHALQTDDLDRAVRLVGNLFWFAQWRATTELHRWATSVLGLPGAADHPEVARLHAAAAAGAWLAGDLGAATGHAAQAVAASAGRADATRRLACTAAGDTAMFAGRLEEAMAAYAEQAELGRDARDPDDEVLGEVGHALALAYADRAAAAIEHADLAFHLADAAGEPARALARYAQGEVRAENDPSRALVLLDDATARATRAGAPFVADVARLTATTLRGRVGAPGAALQGYVQLVASWQHRGNDLQLATTLRNLVELLVRIGADDHAVQVAAVADRWAGRPTFGAEEARVRVALRTARRRLGRERAEAAMREGTSLDRAELLARLRDLAREHRGDLDEVGRAQADDRSDAG